jgi:hypothetical protein
MTCDAAEKASMAAQVEINSGRDPENAKRGAKKAAGAARQAAFTVANLAARYVEEHLSDNKPSWQKEAAWLIQKHIVPTLGDIPLKDVGTSDISALLYKVRKVTPIGSNRPREGSGRPSQTKGNEAPIEGDCLLRSIDPVISATSGGRLLEWRYMRDLK